MILFKVSLLSFNRKIHHTNSNFCSLVSLMASYHLSVITNILLIIKEAPRLYICSICYKMRFQHWATIRVRVSSDHSIIQFNLAKEKWKNESIFHFSVFLYAPNIENWCLFSYFQPKTENMINKDTKTNQ